jgi:hypothetical protein
VDAADSAAAAPPELSGEDPKLLVSSMLEQVKALHVMLASGGKGGGSVKVEESAASKLNSVTIYSAMVNEFCKFRITPSYTFVDLTADACRYWCVNPVGATLRDSDGVLYAPEARVVDEISALLGAGEVPKIHLDYPPPSNIPRDWDLAQPPPSSAGGAAAAGGSGAGGAGGTGGAGGGSGAAASGSSGSSGGAGGGGGGGGALGAGSSSGGKLIDRYAEVPDDAADGAEKADLTQKKRANRRLIGGLSPTFHSPAVVMENEKLAKFTAVGKAVPRQKGQLGHTLASLMLYTAYFVVLAFSSFLRRSPVKLLDQKVAWADAISNVEYHVPVEPFGPTSADFDAPDAATNTTANFYSIRSYDAYWCWLAGPVMRALFPGAPFITPDSLGNTQPQSAVPHIDQATRFVLRNSRVVGAVRLSQHRVQNQSCTISPMLPGLGLNPCVSEYDQNLAEKSTFGPASEGFMFGSRRTPATSFSAEAVVGTLGYYDTSSFAIDIPAEREFAIQTFRQLRAGRWIDDQTRLAMLTFKLYDQNVDAVTVVQFGVEFTPTGLNLGTMVLSTLDLTGYGFADATKVRAPDLNPSLSSLSEASMMPRPPLAYAC